MRLLALLLSLYLACLSCLPCADEEVTVMPAQTAVSAATHAGGGHVAWGDWCSPLCQCHCCAGAVVAPPAPLPLALAQPSQEPTSPRHAALLVASPTQVARAVWQPPQV